MTYRPKEKILTAAELCQWWGITSDQLGKLRLRGLPYTELARGVYLFSEKRIAEWLLANETVTVRRWDVPA